MQVNKQVIIILVLASFLFSAVGAAYYFYNKNQEELKRKSEMATVYIAKEDLKRNVLIEAKHLTQTQIAKQYILNKPLLKKEIIGKYTKETIYKNEVFLKQKLNTKIQKDRAKVLDFTKGSYNMGFELFKNPNYSLVQGDLINIISVYPKGQSKGRNSFEDYEVQYIAQNIKILGFLRDGRVESETITKRKVKKVVKKKVVEEIIDVKSDELILDIDPLVLLGLIKDYNKGNQLWMVKTKESILIESLDNMSKQQQLLEMQKQELLNAKDQIIVKDEKVIKKLFTQKNNQSSKKVTTPKAYKYKWYTPKSSKIKRSAVIDYSSSGDDKNSRTTKSVEISVDTVKECKEIKDKLIVGIPSRFFIRDEATTKSKFKRLLSKNTIIPYKKELKEWYLTCDNMYVGKSVSKPISYKEAIIKIGK